MTSGFAGSLALLLVLGSLNAKCSIMSRFSQDGFDCSDTNAPFTVFVVEDVEIGSVARVEGGSPSEMTVTEVSDARLKLNWGRARVTAYRDTGEVRLISGGVLSTFACEAKKVRM